MSQDGKGGKPKLGRGLAALLGEDGGEPTAVETGPARLARAIPIASLQPGAGQPRRNFDDDALDALAQSIRERGMLQPIIARRLEGAPGRYEIVAGERRWRAAQRAGLAEAPVIIREMSDRDALEVALIENIQREDLNPIEIALAYKRMIDELKLKQEVLGEKVGKKRATVNNYLRLLKLPPEIQIALRDQKISMGHARALINIEDGDVQRAILKEILEKGLSVRKVEELVRNLPEKKKPGDTEPKGEKNIHLVNLEKRLEDKFGNRVYINQKTSGRGDIKISFESTEDLNRLLELLDL